MSGGYKDEVAKPIEDLLKQFASEGETDGKHEDGNDKPS